MNFAQKAIIVGTLLVLGAVSAGAETPSVVLKCRIAQCNPAESCQSPFNLAGNPFNVAAGQSFVFALSDHWRTTEDEFRLTGLKFTGDSYMSRTAVNMNINRQSGSLHLSLDFMGAGNVSRQAAAEGTCEVFDAVPMTF